MILQSNVLYLFSGAGGSHLTGELLGWKDAGAVENNEFCRAVIRKHGFKLVGNDIRYFKGFKVDGICGGFPCTDISKAGNGLGLDGPESRLWYEFRRVISESKPIWVFIENSPLLRTRGLEQVLRDLAGLGYNAEWSIYSAEDVGAPHIRSRMWILAYTEELQCHVRSFNGDSGLLKVQQPRDDTGKKVYWRPDWWAEDICESGVGRVVNGLAAEVDRLRALGNGWVPIQAAEAFKQLLNRALSEPNYSETL